MERMTLTTVNRLTVGDRFYKLKDIKKQVFERAKGHIKRTKYRTYGFWAKIDGNDELIAFDGKTQVVFLRHNNNI